MKRRTFFATTIGALIAFILPAKAVTNVVHYGNYMFHLIPGDKVVFDCKYGNGNNHPKVHTVTRVDKKNLLLECTPRGPRDYPLTHWLPRHPKLH